MSRFGSSGPLRSAVPGARRRALESMLLSAFHQLLRLVRVDVSDDAASSFEQQARALTLSMFRLSWLVLCGLVLLVFPFDFVLYESSSQELLPVLWWQGSIVAITAVVVIVTKWTAWAVARPDVCAVVALLVGSAISGTVVAHTNGLGGSIFYNAHWIPLLVVPLMVKLRLRILATVLGVWAYLASFALSNPAQLAHPSFVSTAVWFHMTAAAAIALGHVVYSLLRERYYQRSALARHASELAEADRVKDEFLANISHELRTPLANILNASSARGSAVDGDWPGTVNRNARQLLTLVDELLMLARMRDAPRSASRWFDIARLVRQVVGDFRMGDGEPLRMHLDDGPRPVCHGDPRALRVVVSNLVSNAVKFSPPGSPAVEVSVAVAGDEILLDVRDHGIGIPEAEHDRIFERFYQVEGTARRRHGGVGIGLALSKQIVEQFGGTISLVSAPDQGSTLMVRLPLSSPPAEAPLLPDQPERDVQDMHVALRAPSTAVEEEPFDELAPDEDRRRILVCEDDADLRRSLRSLLTDRYAVIVARDGMEGLERARQFRPDLVLTDVMMPDMSGLELLRALRGDAELSRVSVVLLTALADTGSKLAGLGLGANDYVTKPYDEHELLARIETQMELVELRYRLEDRVKEQSRELQGLADALAKQQEAERNRIARDLHDDLGQHLTSLGLHAEWLRSMVKSCCSQPEDVEAGFERLTILLRNARSAADRTLHSLRPRLLDELGLDAALVAMAEPVGPVDVPAIVVVVDLDVDVLSMQQSIAIYRIVQEAVANARRHASAKTIRVSLHEASAQLVLDILDDGVGFDARIESLSGSSRLGLVGIRERARILGGKLELTSESGQGTRVLVRAPWPLPSV